MTPSSPDAPAPPPRPDVPAPASTCHACGERLGDGAAFCEACGAPVPAPAAGAAAPGVTSDATLEQPVLTAGTCDRCGGDLDGDGYCTQCGHRALEPVVVDDRGGVAVATHRGRRHKRNEDAGAVGATPEGWPVLIVADGVSASPNPDRAAAAAVAAVAGVLTTQAFTGGELLAAAVVAGHEAASATPAGGDPLWAEDGTHPACTLVVAVVAGASVHVANVGDARAYLLASGAAGWQAAQLSTDDSMAALAVAEGIDPDVALNIPGGHAITAWLGADAHELAPHVARHDVAPGDVVLLCSDGLWNYATDDAALAALLDAAHPIGSPAAGVAAACERLVSWAIDQGGADNITVALAPAAPGAHTDHRSLEDTSA